MHNIIGKEGFFVQEEEQCCRSEVRYEMCVDYRLKLHIPLPIKETPDLELLVLTCIAH